MLPEKLDTVDFSSFAGFSWHIMERWRHPKSLSKSREISRHFDYYAQCIKHGLAIMASDMLVNIGSGSVSLHRRRRAITWTNAG